MIYFKIITATFLGHNVVGPYCFNFFDLVAIAFRYLRFFASAVYGSESVRMSVCLLLASVLSKQHHANNASH